MSSSSTASPGFALASPPDRGSRVYITELDTPVGTLLAGATDEGVCFLEFTEAARLESQMATLRRVFGDVAPGGHPLLVALDGQLAAYFAGTRRDFDLPLVVPGTDFQRRVWDALLRIPYGTTCSYERIALGLGMPNATRAVGHANGQNRIAIVIPCHRVVNKGGRLGGYGGGLWRKEILLELERGERRLL